MDIISLLVDWRLVRDLIYCFGFHMMSAGCLLLQMGKWLPVLSRVVTKTVFGDDPDRHWNVVQNNGMYCS